jgi:hypothetical protein
MLPEGDQSPDMGPLASWQLHGFNLYHGATFQVTRRFRHASGQQIEGGQALYVRLSDDVLLVPVVLVGWDHEEQANDLKALFDFIPVGTDPMADPRVRGWEPPDNVWAQCGIQFIAIRAPWLGEPPSVSPSGACEPEWYKRDYVTDDDLHTRLASALGDEDYQVVYGEDGIDPVTIQFGHVRSELDGECSNYEAKADISGRTIQVNGQGDAYTLAHELGHILLGEAHLSIPKNLMSDPGQRAGELSEAQCKTARERAAAYSKRYRTSLEEQGDALPPERPHQPTREFPVAPPTDAIELGSSEACCEIDGRTQKTLRIQCLQLESPILSCLECCAGDYISVEMGTCDPDAVLDDDQCSTVCCELSPGGTKLETTYGDCVHNRDGNPWPGACAPK